jgi:hypothetical protein
MALPAQPYDLLNDFPGWTIGFELMWRQEQSRVAGGRTIVKDLGSPLWQTKVQSKQLSPNLLDYWRARLDAMENGLATFRGYPVSRTFPIAYPRGAWPTAFDGVSANLHTIGGNNKSVRVNSLPATFKLSIGDLISFGDNLHRVVEAATADGAGLTPLFEVRPHIWPGSVTGVAVAIKRPSCVMAIVPGSISSEAGLDGRGSVAFQAMEARS